MTIGRDWLLRVEVNELQARDLPKCVQDDVAEDGLLTLRT